MTRPHTVKTGATGPTGQEAGWTVAGSARYSRGEAEVRRCTGDVAKLALQLQRRWSNNGPFLAGYKR